MWELRPFSAGSMGQSSEDPDWCGGFKGWEWSGYPGFANFGCSFFCFLSGVLWSLKGAFGVMFGSFWPFLRAFRWDHFF